MSVPVVSRRTVLQALAAGGALAAVAVPGARRAEAAPAEVPQDVPATGTTVLRDGTWEVTVDLATPRVLGHRYGGAQLDGQVATFAGVRANGANRAVSVRVTALTDDHVDYLLQGTSGFSATVRISLGGGVLRWAVVDLDESRGRIGTLEVPGLALVSATAAQQGQIADVRLSSVFELPPVSQDRFRGVRDIGTGTEPVAYALLNTPHLAAAVYTTVPGDERVRLMTTGSGDARRTALGPAVWALRDAAGNRVELPEVTCALTADANDDGTVDWQDAAIALQRLYRAPLGADQVREQVVQVISMNFASNASQPFLGALAEIRRRHLLTDGLSQQVLLKGYQGEGHDSSHPDYAGTWNERAGGLGDLQTLVREAGRWNASVGVHVNAREQLVEARGFRWDTCVQGDARGWRWLDQSWRIDVGQDERGAFAARLAPLVQALPGLGFIYSDTFRSGGLTGWAQAAAVNSHNLPLHAEYDPFQEQWSTATHVAGETAGLTSQILRFVCHQHRDAFAYDPALLLGASSAGYEGWEGQHDMRDWLTATFTRNLPTKYAQHFAIRGWRQGEVRFTGGLVARTVDGRAHLEQDGVVIADGGDVFIPWPPTAPERVYHWSSNGGTRTWTLPAPWRSRSSVTLYRLTDTGRVRVRDLAVRGGAVSVPADARTPYVLYADTPPAQPGLQDGTQGPVRDASFDSRTLTAWSPSHRDGVLVQDDGDGLPYARVTSGARRTLEQQLSGLAAGGTYSASVWVRVQGRRRATLRAGVPGRPDAEVWAESSPLVNRVGDSRRAGSHFQRMKVVVALRPGDTGFRLQLDVAAGRGAVDLADVRVTRVQGADPTHGGHFFAEDFEHVDQGWGPFVYAADGGCTTHLSQHHEGYTRDTISGRFSLKTLDEPAGLVYRTLPQTLRFAPRHAYRIRFDYQADPGAQYRVVVGQDGHDDHLLDVALPATLTRELDSRPPTSGARPAGWTDSLPPQYSAPHATWQGTVVTGDDPDTWLGIVRVAGHAFVLDNLVVDDLGPVAGPAVAPLEVSVGSLVLPAAGQGQVRLTVTNRGRTTLTGLRWDVRTAGGWTGTAAAAPATLRPGASASVTVRVRAPRSPGEAAGLLNATVTARLGSRTLTATGAGALTVPTTSFAAACNQAGIARDTHPLEANLDGSGNSYSASALAAGRVTSGAPVRSGTALFGMPALGAGRPDNVCGTAATVPLRGHGSAVALLGCTLNGAGPTPRGGHVRLHFTDGTSTTAQLTLPSWTAKPGPGIERAVVSQYRNRACGPVHEHTQFGLFVCRVPVPSGRTLFAVTLSDDPRTHVFAVSLVP